MTCREFMDTAAELTPSQLLRMQSDGQPLVAHAGECRSCGDWLESHRLLGNALQTLGAATATATAGPAVEANVLRAFREQHAAPQVVLMPEPAAKRWWQLSRAFEFGAYAAVAAALVVGVFLGVRLLHERQAPPAQEQAQTVTAPENAKVDVQTAAAEVPAVAVKETVAAPVQEVAARETRKVRVKPAVTATTDRSNYVAMMLCDPLMCSGDEQVVRMELPATSDGSTQQTVLADVVIGEDGLVRGMRIVN